MRNRNMVQRLKNSPSSLAFTPTSVETLVKQINVCGSQVKVQLLTLVNCNTTGKDQLAILKQIGNTFKENGGLHKKDDIHILSSMFLHCVSRHPMRRNLSSMFQNICEEYKHEFIHTITEMLETVLTFHKNSSLDVMRKNVDTISSLMENFPIGDEVIQENNSLVLFYLDEALQTFFNSARSEGSPVDQTKMMQHMLTTLKAIIAVLQKCEMLLWQEISNETNISHSEKYISCINNIVTNSLEIMCNGYVTLECRCTAAMIFPGVFIHLPKHYGNLFVELMYHGFNGTLSSNPIISSKPVMPSNRIQSSDSIQSSHLLHSCSSIRSSNQLQSLNNHTELTGICKNLFESISNFFNMKLQLSSTLVLLHGLLVKLPEDVLHLKLTLKNTTTLFKELFVDELINITLKSSGKNVLVLAFKTVALWIEKACYIPNECMQKNTALSKLITEKILPHLVLYVDHHIDTIRHNVNAAIKDCFTLLSSIHIDGSVDKCITEYFNGALNSRGQISMLINICRVVSIRNILDIHKDLPNKIISLLGDVDLASHGCDLYAIICEKHLKEIHEQKIDVKEWIIMWINILYSKLSEKNKEMKANIVNFIIPAILKIHSNIVVDILSDQNMNPMVEKVRAVIVFLKCLRGMKNYVNSTGISFDSLMSTSVNSNGDHMWKNMIRLVDMKNCLTHIDDQVRLDALSLICSSVKTTDPIDNEDINLLQCFLCYNMDSENPSFRYQLLTNLKKVCLRMFNHAFQVAKQNTTLAVAEGKNIDTILTMYGKFLIWLTRFFFKHLYDSAPYSQISTSLQIASLLTEIFHLNKDSKLLNYYVLAENEKQQFTDLLVQCFNDTYDPNRVIVIEIFKQFPIFCSFSDINVEKIFNEAIVNLSSPKPDISSIAAYYITFLALIVKEDDIEKLYNGYHSDTRYYFIDTSIKSNPTLMLLDMNMSLLRKQLKTTKANLISGCQDAPLYGVLYCMRLLFQLQDIDVINTGLLNNVIVSEQMFTRFLGDLIETGLDIIKVVSPYVSNDAPEGYLCDVSLLEIFKLLNLNNADKCNIEVEAQVARMLLLCCWRSMKEVSLLIGIIVSHFSNLTNKSAKHNFLPVSFVINIWNMFCDILLRSKHAGAYELASLGFIKLCSVLWSSYDEELRLIPANAVTSLVNDLLDPVPFDKAQVTRRSAGLPFYLEALCITEPLIKDKQSFKGLMKFLTDLCEHSMLQHDVNKIVISLNILRAFYRNAKLREDVFPYVSSGIIISINGFASSNWAIRNSCTLLFSALMQRIFGVKKCKMTGREFFSKFPILYSFLLDQAKSINESMESSVERKSLYRLYHPSLFPVLLLLSHLYPSTIEASNSLMRLDEFIPYVIRCGSNAVYKTRTMAAKALVPLISLEKVEEILMKLISQIQLLFSDNGKPMDQNFIHGSLLQLKFVSERCFVLPKHIVNLKAVFQRYISISCYCLHTKMSFVIKSLYFDVLTSFLQNGYTDPTYVALPLSLHCLLLSTMEESKSISLPGYALFLRSAVQYIQMIFKLTKELAILEKRILMQLNKEDMKNTLVDINDMVMLFMTSCEYNIVFGMLGLVDNMIKSQEISTKVDEMLSNFICKSSMKDKCFAKALSTLGLVIKQENKPYHQHILQIFHKIFDGTTESFSDKLRSSVIKFCVIFILKLEHFPEQKINEGTCDILDKIWRFLDESCQADQCETCREETASILCVNPQHSVVFVSCKNLIYCYFNCCINLLKDSSLHIRDIAAEILSPILCDSSSGETYIPQPSVILENLFREKISYQLIQDPIQCTTYLISLMLNIDLFKLNDWLNNMHIPSTQPSKKCEASNDKELLKRFVVYEESKENPYYDLKEICEQSCKVLEEFYSSCESSQQDSYQNILSTIRTYYDCNIIRNNDLGWMYVTKFVK